jgi:ubiquinone/menaquinone biosynthesis C-methylase UbiE
MWVEKALTPLLRTFFKLLYHQFAFAYDLVAATVSLGAWKGWVYEVLPYLSGPRVLELGFGPGHLQAALHQKGLKPVGIDRSPQMARQAYFRMRKRNTLPLLVNGYAQFMPFPSASFDQVVATFPSEYIVDPATLAEIQRLLAVNGKLVLLPLAWITGQSPFQRLAAWLFRFTSQAPGWEDRFAQPFRQSGFDVHLEWVRRKNSTLVLILASKPALPFHND